MLRTDGKFAQNIALPSQSTAHFQQLTGHTVGRMRLICDGTRAETRFRLSVKGTSPFKSAGASVQSTTGSRFVRINGSNAGYTMFRSSVKNTGYPLHSPVAPSLPLPCVTVRHYNYMHTYAQVQSHISPWRDVWYTKRHCDRFFSRYSCFPLSISFHQCSIPIHSPTTHAI
jgi:hypothetical protein